MVLYVESSHAYLWMGVWFTARYLSRATDKILFFFQSLHNIRDNRTNTGSTVIKTLNQGPNKNSQRSQWSLGSNSSQPELGIYNKFDEPVPLLLEADRQQVSYALCLNWFGGNF